MKTDLVQEAAVIPGTYEVPERARKELRWLARHPDHLHNLDHPDLSPRYR